MRVATLIVSLLAGSLVASAGPAPSAPGRTTPFVEAVAGSGPFFHTTNLPWPLIAVAFGCLVAGRKRGRDDRR